MGYLFENIEKMDIQAERRNTAEARAQLEQERKEAEKERKEARAQLEKIRRETEAVRREAETYKENVESMIREMVLLSRDLGIDKDAAVKKIMTACRIDQITAQQKVDLYWNDMGEM